MKRFAKKKGKTVSTTNWGKVYLTTADRRSVEPKTKEGDID